MAFPSLSIGDLTAKMPIVQGGMGVGISLSGLASAVANQGGIGVIAGAMIGMKEPDVAKNPIEANLRALRQELSKAREKTQGIIGVNIMVALTTFSQMVRTVPTSSFPVPVCPWRCPSTSCRPAKKKRKSSRPSWSPSSLPPARRP